MRHLLGLALLFAVAAADADSLSGVVIVVIDGDTVLFRPDHYHPASRAFLKLRLTGIDAPEKDQPFGDAATLALQKLALKRRGEFDLVATDRYGRKLGSLWVGAASVNEEMVRQGWAWAASRDPGDAMRGLQHEARSARRGLWQDAGAVPPWTWRRASLPRVD